MTLALRHSVAVLAACAALAGVGCGSDDSEGTGSPQRRSRSSTSDWTRSPRRFDDGTDDTPNPGACNDIQTDSFKAIRDTINSLPDDVDPDIEDALNESFRRLQDLTQEGCANVEEPETDTETTPERTTPEETADRDRPARADRDAAGAGDPGSATVANGSGDGGSGTTP